MLKQQQNKICNETGKYGLYTRKKISQYKMSPRKANLHLIDTHSKEVTVNTWKNQQQKNPNGN